MRKPMILWLADMPGWAYDAILQEVCPQLPQYEHEVFYVMENGGPGGWDSRTRLGFIQAQIKADVIVPMFLLYLQLVVTDLKNKAALMLTGSRPFE